MPKAQKSQDRIITVPLSQLHISPLNVRFEDTSDVAELAALLQSQGQLQNMIVVPEDGAHGVVGGGRRYRAFKLLEQQGKVPADHPVFCLVTTEERAFAASVAENTGRAPMHPADEFHAFKVLVENGTPVEDIAAEFGCTPLVVKRRLLLAKVAPELVEIYRAGGMNLEQLQAFTLTDDQALQCKVWYGAQHHYRHAHSLREALTKGKTEATSIRAGKFVGLAAYEAAGGVVIRDLFGGADSGYIGDMALMNSLAAEKLEAAADALRAEGWSFVKVYPELGWNETNGYGRSKPKVRQFTDEEKAEVAALEEIARAATDAIEADEDGMLTEGEREELDYKATKAMARINELKGALEEFSDRQKKASGAVLGIDYHGTLEIHRGMIDPKAAAEKEKAKAQAEKAKKIAAGEPVEEDKPAVSEALTRKLTANRSAALSAHLLEAPRIALDLLCASLLAKIIYSGFYGSGGLFISPNEQLSALSSTADDMEQGAAWLALTGRRAQLQKELPEDPAKLFAWISEQDLLDVIELLSFCTAACINTTTGNDHVRPLENVEQAIGLTMSDWWQPTRKSYLNQVPKPAIIQALTEAGVGEIAIKQVDKLKKAELAQKAEELLADSGWLPPLLRAKEPPAKAKRAAKAPATAKTTASVKPAARKTAVTKVAANPKPKRMPMDPAAAWPFPGDRH